jgi:citrate lyase subunit beta/citryl-CoA lyase
MALTPNEALYGGADAPPAPPLPPCVHYAGSEKFIRKALALQAERGPVFDISCDCEDGAPIGSERAHAALMAGLIGGDDNRFSRVGCARARRASPRVAGGSRRAPGRRRRSHRVPHAAESTARSRRRAIQRARRRSRRASRPQAHDSGQRAWSKRLALCTTHGRSPHCPAVVSLDFGLMDFVSAHHGAIPLGAMASPAQFEHPLVVRAKCEIAAAALAHGIVPAHNVTRALDNPDRVFDDARRARDHFGYLRMWSIHPGQIDPIVDAMRPAVPEVEKAQAIIHAAQDADWGTASHRR